MYDAEFLHLKFHPTTLRGMEFESSSFVASKSKIEF